MSHKYYCCSTSYYNYFLEKILLRVHVFYYTTPLSNVIILLRYTYLKTTNKILIRMKQIHYKKLPVLFFSLLCFSLIGRAQQFTENFVTAPTLIEYPGYPAWKQIAEVTLDGVVYQIDNGGNGTWAHSSTGGVSNSGCLTYSTAADVTITIKRKDDGKFSFYGAWVKYTNYSSYPAPYLKTSYSSDTYGINSTVTLSASVTANSVLLIFSGLKTLSFDNLIVGPPPPELATVSTSTINLFNNNSVTLGGNVSADGGAAVTERGVVYSTTASPTISNTKTIIGSGNGTYSSLISGLNSNTLYYVKAYATNSVGTSYGSERSFTTAPAFSLTQPHNFNTVWVSTTSQPTPFTKYVEGWNVTATSTNSGLVSISRISGAGTVSPGEGLASLRGQSSTVAEELASLSFKTSTDESFDLQSFKFRYLTKTANTYFNTITVTGYKNGIPVNGAVGTLSNIAQTTASAYSYSTFDLSANDKFNNIDEFKVTASNSPNAARLSAIDIDMLSVQAASVVLSVNTLIFSGFQKDKEVKLDWKFTEGKNLSYFNIQRSADGITFEPIGNIEILNNMINGYTFTDNYPLASLNYYRLKIVDKNGQFKYSSIIKISSKDDAKNNIIFPNPVANNKLYIKTTDIITKKISYEIYGISGKSLLKGTITDLERPIIITGLPKGTYYIKLSNGFSSTFIKD